MTWTLPSISDGAMRDRLERQLATVRQQLDEMRKIGPGPRGRKEHHVAAIRAGEANAKRRIYQLACGHEVSRRNRSGKRRAICGVCEAKCVVVGVKGQG
jgi:hypothetical protein